MSDSNSIYSGLAAAGLSVVGGIAQNFANQREAERAFQRQRQLIKEANIYNAPINQMARLREAGLNPHLIYGQGPGSMVSASAGAPPAAHQENVMQNLGIYASMKQLDIQKRQLDLQERDIKLREAQNPSIIKKNEAEADKTNSEIDVNTQTMLNMMQTREHQTQLIELNKEAIRLSNEMQSFSIEERKRLYPLLEMNQMLQNDKILNDIRLDKIRVAIQAELKDASVRLTDSQIQKIGSEYNLNQHELQYLRGVQSFRYWQEQYQGSKAKNLHDTPGGSTLDKVGRYLDVIVPLLNAASSSASSVAMFL